MLFQDVLPSDITGSCILSLMAGNLSQDRMAVFNSDEHQPVQSDASDNMISDYGFSKQPISRLKSMEPAQAKKKGSFQITSVVGRDGDTETEDIEDCSYSEMNDYSKTEGDHELSSVDTTPNSYVEEIPKDLSHNKASVVNIPVSQPLTHHLKERALSDIHSRFKVVKLEIKGPYTRGRWTCADSVDTPTETKAGEKTEKVVDEAGSGSSSASSSIHFVPGVDDPLKNPLCNVHDIPHVEPSSVSNVGGVTGNSGDSTCTPSMIPAQSKQDVSIPSMSMSNVSANLSSIPLSVSQMINAPQAALSVGQTAFDSSTSNVITPVNSLPDAKMCMEFGFQPSDLLPHKNELDAYKQPFPVPVDYSQTVHPVINDLAPVSQSSPIDNSISKTNDVNYNSAILSDDSQIVDPPDTTDLANVLSSRVPVVSLSSQSHPFLTPPLLEMVASMQQPSNVTSEEGDDRFLLNVFSGASTVAIDNKIEQAMDLVKSHLMFAVREEVEVLKEQIKELVEKNSQLEYENQILKSEATPQTLAKLQKPKPGS